MKLLHLSMGAALFSLPQVMGDTDINTPFKVASGSQKGSCDDQKDILNHMLQQTTDMANAGAGAIGQMASRSVKDQSSSRMIYMLFNINGLLSYIQKKAKLPKGVGKTLQTIGEYYDELAGVADNANFGFRLYCNSEFLVYTEHTYEDGKETENPISDAIDGAKSAYWHIDAQAYVQDNDAQPGSGACSGDTRAFTSRNTKTIAICPSAFKAPIVQNFDDILSDQSTKIKEGDALRNNYLSLPGILLHELAHALSPAVIDQAAVNGDGLSYTVQDCIDLADQKGTTQALLNAETWQLFALSTYLDAWDWATGVAAKPKPLDASSQ